MMRTKNKTREQRRRAKINAICRWALCAAVVILVAASFCRAAAMEEQQDGTAYLASINADNAQRAHVAGLYEEWAA